MLQHPTRWIIHHVFSEEQIWFGSDNLATDFLHSHLKDMQMQLKDHRNDHYKFMFVQTWHSSKLCLFSSLSCMLLSRSKLISLTWKNNIGEVHYACTLSSIIPIRCSEAPKENEKVTWSCRDLNSSSLNNIDLEFSCWECSKAWALSAAFIAPSSCKHKEISASQCNNRCKQSAIRIKRYVIRYYIIKYQLKLG